MTGERFHTLGELSAHLDELLHERDPDTPVVVDHEGVEVDNVEVRDEGGRVVVY